MYYHKVLAPAALDCDDFQRSSEILGVEAFHRFKAAEEDDDNAEKGGADPITRDGSSNSSGAGSGRGGGSGGGGGGRNGDENGELSQSQRKRRARQRQRQRQQRQQLEQRGDWGAFGMDFLMEVDDDMDYFETTTTTVVATPAATAANTTVNAATATAAGAADSAADRLSKEEGGGGCGGGGQEELGEVMTTSMELRPKWPMRQRCVEYIKTSAWNPPPPERKLRGDLIYVEVSLSAWRLRRRFFHSRRSLTSCYLSLLVVVC